MYWVVAYDICNPRRLRRVAKVLEDYGRRVQKSVFEVEVGPSSFRELRLRLESEIEPQEDGVKYYPLCVSCRERTWFFGVGGEAFDDEVVVV